MEMEHAAGPVENHRGSPGPDQMAIDLSLQSIPTPTAADQELENVLISTKSQLNTKQPKDNAIISEEQQHPRSLELIDYDSSPPELKIVYLIWRRDLRGAMEVAVSHGLMSQDLASLAAGLAGRRAGRAAELLCAHQEKQAKGKAGRGWRGGIHATALHMLASREEGREAVSELYAKSGFKLDL